MGHYGNGVVSGFNDPSGHLQWESYFLKSPPHFVAPPRAAVSRRLSASKVVWLENTLTPLALFRRFVMIQIRFCASRVSSQLMGSRKVREIVIIRVLKYFTAAFLLILNTYSFPPKMASLSRPALSNHCVNSSQVRSTRQRTI